MVCHISIWGKLGGHDEGNEIMCFTLFVSEHRYMLPALFCFNHFFVHGWRSIIGMAGGKKEKNYIYL